MIRKCGKCKKEFPETEEHFYKRGDRYKDYFRSICKICHSEKRKKYYVENKDKELELCTKYAKNKRFIKKIEIENSLKEKQKICIICKILKNSKEFKLVRNKSDLLSDSCLSCSEQYEKDYKKIYNSINEIKLKERQRNYYLKNKDNIIKRTSENKKNKLKIDMCLKIHMSVSRAIRHDINRNYSSKNRKSISDYLPYSIKQLKEHLESLFEPWMNWENYGSVSLNKKTWQIDHIIPRTALSYSSMEDENFLKCWALENLRPLDAFENVKKGNKIINLEFIE